MATREDKNYSNAQKKSARVKKLSSIQSELGNKNLTTKKKSKSIAASTASTISKSVETKPRLKKPTKEKSRAKKSYEAPMLRVRGARENNLKNISLDIPRYTFTVVTGLSGSGKSSLAYNTLFKEGQRRYIASLSSYARQFFPSADPADVDEVEGLSPTISIDQKSVSRNPRSTVGTVTKVYDFLRLWFSRLGIAHCPNGHGAISSQSREVVLKNIVETYRGQMVLLMAPMVRDRKGEYRKEIAQYAEEGFARLFIDGKLHRSEDAISLARYEKHTIEIVCDRFVVLQENVVRLNESIDKASMLSAGSFSILNYDAVVKQADEKRPHYKDGKEYQSVNLANTCAKCGQSAPELEPKLFSFNSIPDACSTCKGLGYEIVLDINKVIVDKNKSLFQDASPFFRDGGKLMYWKDGVPQLLRLLKHYGLKKDTPVAKLPQAFLERLFNGIGKEDDGIELPRKGLPFSVIDVFGKYIKSNPDGVFRDYCQKIHCKSCKGSGLSKEALNVLFQGKSIWDLAKENIDDLYQLFAKVGSDGVEGALELLWKPIHSELLGRLRLLSEIGLGYLTIQRKATTLSGGESQRLRLASQIGSGLEECLYILDEPSIGLHPKDNEQLIKTLKFLRDKNNTLVVIEHDEDTMLAADFLIEIGPAAGVAGGAVVISDTPKQIVSKKVTELSSETFDYLLGRKNIDARQFSLLKQTNPNKKKEKEQQKTAIEKKEQAKDASKKVKKTIETQPTELCFENINRFNIENVDFKLPIGSLAVVCGVSGSGKSTFMQVAQEAFTEVFALRKRARDNTKTKKEELLLRDKLTDNCHWISGQQAVDQLIMIDQKPIGRTPRSNAATYTKAWDIVRDIFATKKEAKIRGYKKGRFSFNVKGGRCEECSGAGVIELDMKMFSAVEVVCESCNGKRFNTNTLDIYHHGKNIHDILDMNLQEAASFFEPFTKLHKIFSTLCEIGLGYLRVGQPSTTLSGGEAQRIKLARELAKSRLGRNLYLLDEPTTGLHFADIEKLMEAVGKLIATGNTVVIIEHNLEVLKLADHVVEMGPEGGKGGGKIIFTGTPQKLAVSNTATGQAMKDFYIRENKKLEGYFLKNKNLKQLLPQASINKVDGIGKTSKLEIVGLKTNNLRNVSLSIAKNQMVVFTGVSGSGKTSLLFDSIFVEGQRRYMESLSSYARRFLEQGPKVDVEKMENLSPTIAIDRENSSRNPRSLVATTTEIYDNLRLIYANVGKAHCPHCYEPLSHHSVTMAVDNLLSQCSGEKKILVAAFYLKHFQEASEYPERNIFQVTPQLAAKSSEEAREKIEELIAQGYSRFLIDDALLKLSDISKEKRAKLLKRFFRVGVVIDRFKVEKKNFSRIIESFEKAYEFSHFGSGGGLAFCLPDIAAGDVAKGKKKAHETGILPANWLVYANFPTCFRHAYVVSEKITPRHFSFNHYAGVCDVCKGIAEINGINPHSLLVDGDKPLFDGAFDRLLMQVLVLENENKIDLLRQVLLDADWRETMAYDDFTKQQRDVLYFGHGLWEGLHAVLYRVFSSRKYYSYKQKLLARVGARMTTCGACRGERLKRDFGAVTFFDASIAWVCRLTVLEASAFFKHVADNLSPKQAEVCGNVIEDICYRLNNLIELGLGYMTLTRKMFTLSGGESQRVRLSTQLGSRLSGTMYVLDEPTVGLHEADTRRLLKVVRHLLTLDNSVMMVEHAAPMIENADFIVDVGPGAGERGGNIVYCGENKQEKLGKTSFYDYLYGEKVLQNTGKASRKKQFFYSRNEILGFDRLVDKSIFFKGVERNNLKKVEFHLPLNRLIGIAGVSGSGKSSLMAWLVDYFEQLSPFSKDLNATKGKQVKPAVVEPATEGMPAQPMESMRTFFDRMVVIDQGALSSNSRSVIATSMGIYDHVREVFAETKLARQRGYDKGFFSFNSSKGQCTTCAGLGKIEVEMHFVADVMLPCTACNGKRFRPEVLQVYYRGKNMADVLQMTAAEASEFFFGFRKVVNALSFLLQVGLGYLKLGFAVKLLSSGERQRLKIADQLAFANPNNTLYLLDEPTTGLHFRDAENLMKALDGLLEKNATVLVVEHNIEFLRSVDHLIDLGPVGGDAGGYVLCEGSVEYVRDTLTKRSKLQKSNRSEDKSSQSKRNGKIAKASSTETKDGKHRKIGNWHALVNEEHADACGATYRFL